MKFHVEILSSAQSKLINQLGRFSSEHGFYLGGGTAIALLLGHRQSDDLDWFSQNSIGDPALWTDKLETLGLKPRKVILEKGTFYATINRVRISILEYPYRMLFLLVPWKSVGCNLASLDDLACMKLSAIASRGSKKDFVDVYALIKEHKTLSKMLTLYKKKFPEVDLIPVLRGLSYFDDADKDPMPRMLWRVKWQDIKQEILTELKKSLK